MSAAQPVLAPHRSRTGILLLSMFALALAACAATPEPGKKTTDRLMAFVDTSLGASLLTATFALPRYPGSEGLNTTLHEVGQRLERSGFVRIDTPDSAGADPAGAPAARQFLIEEEIPVPSWQPGSATLTVLGPDGFVAADTRETPMVLAWGSGSTPQGGLVTDLIYLGNGTYEQEYEGVDVRGALVYGRRSLTAVSRTALRHGALGAVSPAAETWNDTDAYPDLVSQGRVSPGAIGFKISPSTALNLEEAMERGGGRVRVQVQVDARTGSDFTLRTLVAEIAGTDPTGERVALIAPVSGPAPGAGDLSGAAAVLETAVALKRGIEEGKIRRPRRTLVFVWGASVDGTTSWLRRFPTLQDQLHSATVVQLVGTHAGAPEAPLMIERVPDPGAVWTRPPFHHTPWGASRPPHWPFEGHYLSELTEEMAGNVRRQDGKGDTLRWEGIPYEGASDHVPLLELNIPAQRLWHFPYPFYRSSLDTPGRIDQEQVGEAALVAAGVALYTAAANASDARGILRLLEARARERLAEVRAQAETHLAEVDEEGHPTGDRPLEEDIANAWKIWYLEAFESVMGHPIGSEGGALRGRVELAVARLDREWNDEIGSLGLRLLPLPERFQPSRQYVK